jgi:hypothetical protein
LKRGIEWRSSYEVWLMVMTIVYLNHPGEISPSPSDIELAFGRERRRRVNGRPVSESLRWDRLGGR